MQNVATNKENSHSHHKLQIRNALGNNKQKKRIRKLQMEFCICF